MEQNAVIRELQREIKDLKRRQVRFRRGEVVDTSPFQVTLGGSDVAHDVDGSPGSLAVGDQVAVLTFENDFFVLGKIG